MLAGQGCLRTNRKLYFNLGEGMAGEMNKQKAHHVIKYVLLLAYIVLLVYMTFFAEMFGRTCVSSYYRYNLVPFKEIMRFVTHFSQLGTDVVLINIVGNVVAFMPLGFLLPLIADKRLKFFSVTLISFGLSLGIELTQLITRVGCCDVDDLILNTIGGMMGYGCYVIFRKIRKKA